MSSANKDVLAIAKLVREQEKTKTKRRMDGTTNAPTKYQVAKCDVSKKLLMYFYIHCLSFSLFIACFYL